MTKRLVSLLFLACLVGAGCWAKKPVAKDPVPEFIPNQDLKAPSDAWGEYQHTKAAKDVSRQTMLDEKDKRTITFNVPSSWKGEGGFWSPDGSRTNYVRAQYLPNAGVETEWSHQQEQVDIHEVAHAEKGDTYTLLVNHKTLKASIFKLFRPDQEHPGQGFYFVECRVPFDAPDRDTLWSACKAAVESATFATAP